MAAQSFGIETGGYMPKNFRTLEGCVPAFAEEFGMDEHPSVGYKDRTYANVCIADGTIRFFVDPHTVGERCTLNAIKLYNKPYCDIQMLSNMDRSEFIVTPLEEVRDWLGQEGIRVLNVAGHSETTAPGIQKFVESYMTDLFNIL